MTDVTTTGEILPFIFENIPVRGRLIRLPNLGTSIPSLPTDYPAAAQALCEVVLTNALMATELKNPDVREEATISVHIQSEGPVKMITSQCTHNGNLRAFAKLTPDATPDMPFEELFGSQAGICAITVDYGPKSQPYQSLIALDRSSVLRSVRAYFDHSVQLKTLVHSAVDPAKNHSSALLFLQAMPHADPVTEDDWQRLQYILDTIKPAEILPGLLSGKDLLARLFAEDDVRVLSEESLEFKSENLRERMELALRQLGQEEVMRMIKEDGAIKVTDEFTGQSETFSAEDIAALFAATH